MSDEVKIGPAMRIDRTYDISRTQLIPDESSDPRDPASDVKAIFPKSLYSLYEIHSYRHAASILVGDEKTEFRDILRALIDFAPGKNAARDRPAHSFAISHFFSTRLRALGWNKTTVEGDLLVTTTWQKLRYAHPSRRWRDFDPEPLIYSTQVRIDGYFGPQKMDMMKSRVGIGLEWNRKAEVFDGVLLALGALFSCGMLDVGVLIMRSDSLIEFEAAKRRKADSSTEDTRIARIIRRLDSGNVTCPILLIGITPRCIDRECDGLGDAP